ncbi:MAG: TAXI family TRAP transporter solute-binding subunit [Candidatus Riflebacteria bacterium]
MKNTAGSVPTFAWPLFLVIAALAILMLSVEQPELKVETPLPPQLYSSSFQLLATGNRLGTYYPAGHILVDWFNRNLEGTEEIFRAIETNGSIDNISLLKKRMVALAMVESRIVQEACRAEPGADLQLVWPLWPDVVQLVKAPELASASLSELNSGFFGQLNSSTFRTTEEIFSSFNLQPLRSNVSPDQVLGELASGRIKFAMIQAGIPNRTVSDALIFHGCSLVDFDEALQNSLLPKISSAMPVMISAGYYGEKQPAVRTFGIPNMLVATGKTSSATIELICELISKSSSTLNIRHQAFAQVPSDLQQALKVMQETGVPIHPGTLAWLSRQNILPGVIASETAPVEEQKKQ